MLDKLNGHEVALRPHHGALTNGRLSTLYHLYNQIEGQKPSSSAQMLEQLSVSSGKTQSLTAKPSAKSLPIAKTEHEHEVTAAVTPLAITPFSTTPYK